MWKYFTVSMIIRYLALLFVYVWAAIEIFRQIKESRQKQGQTNADTGSLLLIYAAIFIGYGIGIPFAFLTFGRITWGEPYPAILGLAVIVVGASIRFIAMRTLSRHFTYAVGIQEQHELIEQGLYRSIRHPAYLGELMVFLGIGLAFANWISLVILLVCPFIAFHVRMNVEEKVLLDHFAARYTEYRKRTWRLVPWLY